MAGALRRAGWSGALLALAVVILLTWLVMERWQEAVLEEWEGAPPESAEIVVPAELPDGEALHEARLPVAGDYDTLLQRPLFMSTRRPPEPEDTGVSSAEPEAALPELSDLRLTSVVITGDGRYAWFKSSSSDRTLRLAPGETLRQWTLHRVEEDHVIFSARDSEHRLDLRPAAGEAPPAATRVRSAPAGRSR